LVDTSGIVVVGVVVEMTSEVARGLTVGAGVGVPQATSRRTINKADRAFL
jgi:hypothetical protein